MSEIDNTEAGIDRIRLVDGETLYDMTLVAGQEISFTIVNRNDGSPAVGMIDVIHRSPTVKGKGDSEISWRESLKWMPSVNSPSDSWQKTVTLKNFTKSTQAITFRFFPLR